MPVDHSHSPCFVVDADRSWLEAKSRLNLVHGLKCRPGRYPKGDTPLHALLEHSDSVDICHF